MLRSNLLLLCSASFAALAGHAQAQTQATLPAAAEAGQPAAPSVGEVVVTAQRRSENLQNVPITITSLTASKLADTGVSSLQGLNVAVAGLTFNAIQGNATPKIRGVGSSAVGPGDEPEVALYVDGVYYASPQASIFNFNNLQQLTVLKGPQGTLFGRNAVGGLVQITTLDPRQDLHVDASAGYGNYNTSTGSLYVTEGLAQNLAGDLSVQASFQGDGYGKNLATGVDAQRTDHDIAVRSKLLFTPDSSLRVALSLDFEDEEGSPDTIRLEKGTRPAPGTGPAYGGSPWDTEGDIDGYTNVRDGGAALKIDKQLSGVTVSSITAFRELTYDNALDLDVTASPYQAVVQSELDRQFTQEFQLQSRGAGRFKWTLGLFYFHSRVQYDPLNVPQFGAAISPEFPLTDVNIYSHETTNSIAGYGQASYEILPRTTFTFGMRYSYEKRTAIGQQILFLEGGPLPNQYEDAATSVSKPSFRVALDHRFSDALLVYASFNDSYKSGGFNIGAIPSAPYLPETINAYEVGAKTNLFGRRLTFDLSGFYYDYKNIQTQEEQNGSIGVLNGAAARLYGIDIDTAFAVNRDLSLSGNFEYLNSKFQSFPNALISSPEGGVPVVQGDATGNELPVAPKYSGSVTADYNHPLPLGALHASGTVYYNNGWFVEADNVIRQDSFVEVNASLAWKLPDERTTLSVWGKNLSQAIFRTNGITITPYGNHAASFAPPRTYGVSVGYKF